MRGPPQHYFSTLQVDSELRMEIVFEVKSDKAVIILDEAAWRSCFYDDPQAQLRIQNPYTIVPLLEIRMNYGRATGKARSAHGQRSNVGERRCNSITSIPASA